MRDWKKFIIIVFQGGIKVSKLYYRYGAMNSGKTTLLLQVAHNYEERGMKVLILKPKIDTKGDNKIVTRIGLKRKSFDR